ncbi:MAG: ribose 5-phosphate isomerase B [Candidatus Marinimicrobia bacterium]|nr:ribose 5-phosphate isomerase B [Candidatus Neomarinimicrobiota bacterium]
MDHTDSNRKIIYIGSDHAGYETKSHVIDYVSNMGYSVIDKGTFTLESADYPDYGVAVGKAVVENPDSSGIIICGTGIGISIAANKVKGIRAALCTTPLHAEMARKHNNANILAMGARMTSLKEMDAIINSWFSTDFEGGRHQKRVDKIHSLTEK